MQVDHATEEKTIGNASPEIRLAIEKSLGLIIADPRFNASRRNRRFLKFIVEESLAGREDRLKSYNIAVDVFGRNSNFDSTIDPIVRVEAARLRQSLNKYYSEVPDHPNPRINIPKGRYIPIYIAGADTAPAGPNGQSDLDVAPAARNDSKLLAADPAPDSLDIEHATRKADERPPSLPRRPYRGRRPMERLWVAVATAATATIILLTLFFGGWQFLYRRADTLAQPVLIVDQAASLADDSSSHALARTMTSALVLALSRFDGMRVVQTREALSSRPGSLASLMTEQKEASVYVLETSTQSSNDTIEVNWRLINARSLETLWSETSTEKNSGADRAEASIAKRIAAFISDRQWLLGGYEMRSSPNGTQPGHACVARARAYRTTLAVAEHAAIRDCLEQTVRVYPDYADAWVWLASTYIDEYRFGYNLRESHEVALNRAGQAAKRAVQIAPFSAAAQAITALAAHLAGDDELYQLAAGHALSINPNDTRVLRILGSINFARGNYDYALEFIEKANSLVKGSPNLAPTDYFVTALASFAKYDYSKTIRLLNNLAQRNFLMEAFLAAAYAKSGDLSRAASHVEFLLKLKPNFAEEIQTELSRQRYNKALIDRLVD